MRRPITVRYLSDSESDSSPTVVRQRPTVSDSVRQCPTVPTVPTARAQRGTTRYRAIIGRNRHRLGPAADARRGPRAHGRVAYNQRLDADPAHTTRTSGSKSPYLRGERVGTAQRVLVRGQAPGPWRTARIRGRTRRPTARRLLQARVNVWEGQRLHRHRCASAGIQGVKVTTRIARHSGQELLTRAWTFSSQPLHKA